MFYLANDVIQHAKKKGYKQYLDGFREVLKRATGLVKDDKIAPKITRIFNIWTERSIYSDEFLNDLKQILGDLTSETIAGKESTNNSSSALTNKIATDFSLVNLEKKMKEADLASKPASALVSSLNVNKIDKIDSQILSLLKDKKAGELCLKELSEIESSLKHTVQAMEKQFNFKTSFVDALEKCALFYETQKEEVKIVANAYENFTTRVKAVRTKLSNNQISLPSPYPSPVIDAPSPNSDDDLMLPTNDSPLPGLQSLLNIANENSSKNNKISSLDKRLSSLMQNLPAMSQQLKSSDHRHKDKKHQEEATWSPLLFKNQPQQQQLNINVKPPQITTPQQQPLINPLVHQPLLNQPIMAPAINCSFPPPPFPQHPPFIPQHSAPHLNQIQNAAPMHVPRDQHQNYYPGVQFREQFPPKPPHLQMNSPQVNSIFNNGLTNSPSVQQIQSVISTRNEQQELNDKSIPYDPYSVGMNNTADSFCEPADMDLGDSDDEEMNRSSNSQRVLKVIETSDESSNYSGNNSGHNLNNSFNSSHHKKSLSTGYSQQQIPPQLPPHVTNVNCSNSLNSSSGQQSTNLHQYDNYYDNYNYNGKPPHHQSNNTKLYSPVKAFHHQKDNNNPQYNRSPRFNNKNYNNHHQLISPTSSVPYKSQPMNTPKLDYYNANNSTPNQSVYASQSNNANRKGMWKNNNSNNKFHNNNPHQNRNRSFNNNKNLNNNSVNFSNLSTTNSNLTSLNSSNNLTNLNPQHNSTLYQ